MFNGTIQRDASRVQRSRLTLTGLSLCCTGRTCTRQWRIREARRRETSIRKRVAALVNALLGFPWISREPSVILSHVVLGSRDNAASREQLYDAGVTHIVNCAKQVSNYYEGEFVYIKLNLHDSTTEDLIPHFQTVAKFLKRVEVLRGRALIHCISGQFDTNRAFV